MYTIAMHHRSLLLRVTYFNAIITILQFALLVVSLLVVPLLVVSLLVV